MADVHDAGGSDTGGSSQRQVFIEGSWGFQIGNYNTQHIHLAEDSLTGAAAQLAAEVQSQWRAEAQVRRVNDDNALPLSWTDSDADLVDRMSSDGTCEEPEPHAKWGEPPSSSGALLPLLRSTPDGRLVVLGDPGTGKTVLMVRLLLDLLAADAVDGRRGNPIPVLLPLSSWNPMEQDFTTWFMGRLYLNHPWLARPLLPDLGTVGSGELLLARGWLLPLLDGLDEIPDGLRSHAVEAINEAVTRQDKFVLSCRTAAYRQAVNPPDTVAIPLRRAAAITLCEPAPAAVRAYVLREGGGTPDASVRWATALAALGSDTPAGRTLRTPLMISLASEVYNPRPGTPRPSHDRRGLPDPTDLCDQTRFPTADVVEDHLLDSFLHTAYRRRPGRARVDPWPARRAERYLTFLAQHLEYNLAGRTEIAWWELPVAAAGWGPVVLLSSASAILGATATSILGNWIICLVSGLFLGAVAPGIWLVRSSEEEVHRTPAKGLRWSAKAITVWAATTAALLAMCWLIWGFEAAVTAYMVDFVWTYLILIVIGISPADLTTQVSPAATLATDRRFTRIMTLVGGVGTTVAAVAMAAVVNAPGHTATRAAWYGLRYGLAIGGCALVFLGLWLRQGASGQFAIGRAWLALCRRVPWRLMDFLSDAHLNRGVLRLSGATYQFRHARLQQRLAGRKPSPRRKSIGPGSSIVTPETAEALRQASYVNRSRY